MHLYVDSLLLILAILDGEELIDDLKVFGHDLLVHPGLLLESLVLPLGIGDALPELLYNELRVVVLGIGAVGDVAISSSDSTHAGGARDPDTLGWSSHHRLLRVEGPSVSRGVVSLLLEGFILRDSLNLGDCTTFILDWPFLLLVRVLSFIVSAPDRVARCVIHMRVDGVLEDMELFLE